MKKIWKKFKKTLSKEQKKRVAEAFFGLTREIAEADSRRPDVCITDNAIETWESILAGNPMNAQIGSDYDLSIGALPEAMQNRIANAWEQLMVKTAAQNPDLPDLQCIEMCVVAWEDLVEEAFPTLEQLNPKKDLPPAGERGLL